MLNCSRMTHRVHTILSILAEDHAPAALRPSIIFAVDWPTVAEEAPATGDDSGIACAASGLLSGIGGRENLPALTLANLPLLAARLATVAASLTVTGDKAMATHATALWGAAATLVGLPNAATATATTNPAGWDGLINGIASLTHVLPFCSRADEMLDIVMRWHGAENALNALANKASGIIPGAKHTNLGDRATLIATALDRIHEYRNNGTAEAFGRGVKIRAALGIMPGADILGALAILRETLFASNGIGIMSAASMQAENLNLARQGRDRALADIHALRDILKVPEGGNLVDHASAFAERHMRRVDESTAEAYRMHAENTRLRAQVDRMIAAMREDAPLSKPQTMAEAHPQPGDVVPWAEVESECIYYDSSDQTFLLVHEDTRSWLWCDGQDTVADFLRDKDGWTETPVSNANKAILVARDLGTDPEAWRKAMREWTANGNKPTSKAAPKAAEDVLPLRGEFTHALA